MDSEITDNGKW